MGSITTNLILGYLAIGQLPAPKKSEKTQDEEKTHSGMTFERHPFNALQTILDGKKQSPTQNNNQDSEYKGLTIDPLSAGQQPVFPLTYSNTPEQTREHKILEIVTRNPTLSQNARPIEFQLNLNDFGVPTQEARILAEVAMKPVEQGGLGLKIKLDEAGFPDGTLYSDKYQGTFILQFQDNSILVTNRKDENGKPLPNATFVRVSENGTTRFALDKSKTSPLIWTAPLTKLCAYPVINLNHYATYMSTTHQNYLGIKGPIEIETQADGTLFITERTGEKRKGTLVKRGEKWVWDLSLNTPYRTTSYIRDLDLTPLSPMSPETFQDLVKYDPSYRARMEQYASEVKQTNFNLYSKNCMKHNPDSPFLHGNGISSSYSSGGFKLSLLGYDNKSSYDSLIRPSGTREYKPDPEMDKLIAEWIRTGKLPDQKVASSERGTTFGDLIKDGKLPGAEVNQNPNTNAVELPNTGSKITPPPSGSRIQAFVDKEGNYYIITKHEIYRFNNPSRVRSNNYPEVYNFDREERGKNRYATVSGYQRSQIDSLVRYGNITSRGSEFKLASYQLP